MLKNRGTYLENALCVCPFQQISDVPDIYQMRKIFLYDKLLNQLEHVEQRILDITQNSSLWWWNAFSRI